MVPLILFYILISYIIVFNVCRQFAKSPGFKGPRELLVLYVIVSPISLFTVAVAVVGYATFLLFSQMFDAVERSLFK